MTASEALAVNIIAPYIVGMKRALDSFGAEPEAYGDSLEALTLLADRAHKALGAGVDGAKVRERWAAA
jgi:hypothetical protein